MNSVKLPHPRKRKNCCSLLSIDPALIWLGITPPDKKCFFPLTMSPPLYGRPWGISPKIRKRTKEEKHQFHKIWKVKLQAHWFDDYYTTLRQFSLLGAKVENETHKALLPGLLMRGHISAMDMLGMWRTRTRTRHSSNDAHHGILNK